MQLSDFVEFRKPAGRWESWTASIGQTEGRGPSREAATEALFATVQHSLDGDAIPTLLFFHGYVALIWRERESWCYSIREVGTSGKLITSIVLCGPDPSRAERDARHHLAQYAQDVVQHPEEAAEIITDPESRRDFIRDAYRMQEVQRIMAEDGLGFVEASMKVDGISWQKGGKR